MESEIELADVSVFRVRKTLEGNKVIERTQDKFLFPTSISQEAGFAGVMPYKSHPELMHIIMQSEHDKFYKKEKICYCTICKQLKNSEGGNYMKHLKRHTETKISDEKRKEQQILYLCWAIEHNISFRSFFSEKWRKLNDGWFRHGHEWDLLEELADKIHNEIKQNISKEEILVISTDGWSCTQLGRFQGVMAHTPGKEGQTFALGLVPSESSTFGSEEIKVVIEKTLEEYDISKEKIVSILTDATNENPAAANLLNLEWDGCFLHLLSLLMSCFWENLPEDLQSIINFAREITSSCRFKDFLRNNRQAFPELQRGQQYRQGCPTRWMSFIKELTSLNLFWDCINQFIDSEPKMDKNYLPETVRNQIQILLPELQEVEKLNKEMEGEEYNKNIGNVSNSFAFIQNICKTVIFESTLLPEYKKPFEILDSIITERFFDSGEEYIHRALIASLLNTASEVPPEQTMNRKERIITYIEEELSKAGLPSLIAPMEDNSMTESQPIYRSLPRNPNDLRLTSSDKHPVDAFLEFRSHNVQEDPFLFWSTTTRFPGLSQIAKGIFARRASTISNESWFSKTSKILDRERGNFTPDHFKTLCYLKGNQHLFNKICETSDTYPLPEFDIDSDESEY